MTHFTFFTTATTLLLTMTLGAVTIHVPVDQPTIQAGIDMASTGDTVLVANGTYQGNGNRDLDFRGKGILLKSFNGPDTTIIDCQGSPSDPHRAFVFHSNEDSTAIVDGFTIRTADSDSGAVSCHSAAPTIRNCVISENSSSGIRCYLGFGLIIENCTISQNTGDGIFLDYALARITGCDINSNASKGILAWNNARVVISNTIVRDNGDVGFWDWIFLGYFRVTNCTFVGNRIGMFHDGDFPKSVTQSPAADSSSIDKSIFAFNRERGIQLGAFAHTHDALCNDAYGNPQGDYVNTPYGAGDAKGNFSLDPLFCDTLIGDYHISSTSQCAPSNNWCGQLIGRYGVACSLPYICGDANSNGLVNIADVVYLLLYEFGLGPQPNPLAAGDVNCNVIVNIADAVFLIQYIFNSGPAPCEAC